MQTENRLETDRLILRIDTEADYVDILRNGTDAEIKAFLGLRTDEEVQVHKDRAARGMTTYRTELLFFHLIEKEHDRVIGSFAFHNWHPLHRRSEIGYAMLDDAYKNKGFMREAFPHIMAYGFEVLHLNRMEAFIHPENIASKQLVLRAGFQQEGYLREHYSSQGVIGDSILYALLRKDYYGNDAAV